MFLAIEIYAYQAIKTVFKFNWISKVYVLINFCAYLLLSYRIFYIEVNKLNYSDNFYEYLSIPIALIITLSSYKFILCLHLIFEDFFRLVLLVKNSILSTDSINFSTSRRSWISKMSLMIASIPIPFVIYGIFKGRYDFRVINYEIEFDDLPVEFDGYQLTHISDIHAGSLSNKEKTKYAVDLINKQKSNLVLFTE